VPDELEAVLARSMSKDPAKRHESMYAFAEDLRRIQYGLGMPPTALEVAATEWAAASPVNLSDSVARGPVITTVNKNSRRAARASQPAPYRRGADDEARAAKPASTPMRAGLIGAGVAVGAIAVVGGIAFAVLQVV
jgi:hypothetical protein